MEAEEWADLELKADPETLDADGYISLWNVASASLGGDTALARELAGKLLGFLCKHRCGFVVISSTDASYLDERFERDTSLLYNWKPDSEMVDILSQHAQAPYESLKKFLVAKKFNASKNYSPKRADRVEWFTEDWNVG